MTSKDQIEYLKQQIQAGSRTPNPPHIDENGTISEVLCFDEIYGSPEIFKKLVDLRIRELESLGFKAVKVIGDDVPQFAVKDESGSEAFLDNSRGNRAILLMEKILPREGGGAH